ncbi:hypothetical protein SDC9_82692 [bioreactor metagenome]|uniref:Rieske domain-containing protein n=1 Tax=bioreactor metagenome TaxID=1076179 RepID=A0A644Z646_9ZZZZ
MPFEKVSETGSISNFEPPWFYAAEENSLTEGKLLRVDPGGRNVLLIKMEEQVQAFSNLCPHAKCPMIKEDLRSLF